MWVDVKAGRTTFIATAAVIADDLYDDTDTDTEADSELDALIHTAV